MGYIGFRVNDMEQHLQRLRFKGTRTSCVTQHIMNGV